MSALAALLKPTAALLALTPLLTNRFRWQDLLCVLSGATAVAVAAMSALAAAGGLASFITTMMVYVPMHASSDRLALDDLLTKAAFSILHLSGLVLAASVTLQNSQSPRARVMIWLTAFGLIHFVAQGKGFFYHSYPLLAGLACWGAWSIRHVPPRVALLALVLLGGYFGLRGKTTIRNFRTPETQLMPAPASALMEEMLMARLPRGARVQMLDTAGGAFLAMARANMRQATSHIYWFFLIAGPKSWRDAFIEALKTDPPDAVLLTSSIPSSHRSKLDNWPEFNAQLSCCFVLVESRTMDSEWHPWRGQSPVSWQLYIKRNSG